MGQDSSSRSWVGNRVCWVEEEDRGNAAKKITYSILNSESVMSKKIDAMGCECDIL